MFRKAAVTALVALCMSGSAYAGDAIVGNWRTDSGETAAITGGGPFSIRLKTGKYAGKRIGTMNADGGGKYSGEITDPAKDKTYSGSATLSGRPQDERMRAGRSDLPFAELEAAVTAPEFRRGRPARPTPRGFPASAEMLADDLIKRYGPGICFSSVAA